MIFYNIAMTSLSLMLSFKYLLHVPFQMVSRPPFTVEIHKPNGKILAVECQFNVTDMDMETEEEQLEDQMHG